MTKGFKKIAAAAAAAVMAVSMMAVNASAVSNSSVGYSEWLGKFEGIISIETHYETTPPTKQAVSTTVLYDNTATTISASLYMVAADGSVAFPYTVNTVPNSSFATIGAGTPNLTLMCTAYGTHTVTNSMGLSWSVNTQVFG